MNALLQKAREVNRNGAISGRSLSYCNLSEFERARGAADAVTGVRRFIPSNRNIKDCSRHDRTGGDRVWPYPTGRA
jgi:hypothetical protein